MAVRGRPRTNSSKPAAKLSQATKIVMIYDDARKTGAKREVAISEAVAEVRQRYPSLKVSRSEVIRVLAEWRPRGVTQGFYFEEKIIDGNPFDFSQLCVPESLLGRPGVKQMMGVASAPRMRVTTCFWGAIPQVPRSNAAMKPRKRTQKVEPGE